MEKGFTLIEMLIVIVIIGILAGALIPRIGTARDKANDTAREANVRSLATAMVQYGLDHGNYPESVYDNENNRRLTNYGISESFDWQPTDNDYYDYIQLDGGSHFVFFTQLSEGSKAGNCTISIDCLKNGESTHIPLKDCEAEGGTMFSKISTVIDGQIERISDDDRTRYSAWNTKVVGTKGSAFCYVQ